MTHAALKVETLPIARLKPHPKNPRQHPKRGGAEWESLKSSLANSYFDPLVWNKRNGKLVSGHLRRLVMEDMGITTADVVVVNVSEREHVAMMLRANRHGGDWDAEQLTGLLESFDDSARMLAGFTGDDVADLLKSLPTPADAPEAPQPSKRQAERTCPTCGQKRPKATEKPNKHLGRARWRAMVSRCTNPKDKDFKDYGARGITVCERWMAYQNFIADMGPTPHGLTLERNDNSKGYSKENCRWATRAEQSANRRGVKGGRRAG